MITEEQNRMCELAIEAMFEAITVYGEREDYIVRSAVCQKLTEEQVMWLEADELLEHECFVEAVNEAVLFYEDEAGGSHDLSHLEGLTTWDVLAELPTH